MGTHGEEAPIRISSQSDPGLPGVGNGTEVLHSEPHQGEEKEVVESGTDSRKVKVLLARLKTRGAW